VVKFVETLGLSRASYYYKSKKKEKDWKTKIQIEEALRIHPAYGHKRLAIFLKQNKKKILRVMKLFGIKPYRRMVKKVFKIRKDSKSYPNLLLTTYPSGRKRRNKKTVQRKNTNR
jgi:hypothetical protein